MRDGVFAHGRRCPGPKDTRIARWCSFAVGFETTAPANAMAVARRHGWGLKNFSVLVSHVLVPPAIRAVLSSPENRVQAFIAAGHVCTITGMEEYFHRHQFRVPIVITGFEPLDILQGVLMCVAPA